MITIDYLANHSHHIAILAEHLASHYQYVFPEKTASDYVKRLEQHLDFEKLPLALIALDQAGQLLGTCSLRITDLDSRPDLGPWLGGVFVLPEKRKQGVGEFLVHEAKERAKQLRIEKLFLFTFDKANWYAKLGWNTSFQTMQRGFPVTVMELMLTP